MFNSKGIVFLVIFLLLFASTSFASLTDRFVAHGGASTTSSTGKILVLTRNASSLDSEETKVTDFLMQNGYQYDLADSSTITGLSVSSYKVIYFRTGSEPTGYNSTIVLNAIQSAIEGGSSLIIEYYGNYLAKYLGYGSVTSSSWCPVVNNKTAYVKSISSHEIFNGISTWDPPTKPDKEEQYMWSLDKTGCSYTCRNLSSITGEQKIEYYQLYITYGWYDLYRNN
ncbi:MAG: hypothetical protein HY754_01650 [Nitrospirae bacterium]|nr:hypothetical protein [Nitrospirota bacterium]